MTSEPQGSISIDHLSEQVAEAMLRAAANRRFGIESKIIRCGGSIQFFLEAQPSGEGLGNVQTGGIETGNLARS
jgi:hypothetical protein